MIELDRSPASSHLVECSWIASANEPCLIIPDGTHHLVLGNFYSKKDGQQKGPVGKSIPVLTHPIMLTSTTPIIGIRLKAFARETKNTHQKTKERSHMLTKATQAYVSEDYDHSLSLLNQMVVEHYHRVPILTQMVNKLLMNKGDLEISSIAEEWQITKQSLSKTYASKLGMSLKELSTIWKLNQFLSCAYQNYSLTEAGLNSGFYDQSHAIRTFRKVFGTAPSSFLRINDDHLPSILSSIQQRFQGKYDPITG